VHVVAPKHGAHFFKDIDQAEGQQHLVQVVALVEVAKQQPFERQAEHDRQHRAAQNGQRQAAEQAGERIRQIRAQHIETAMRQVDHAHDAEDQRQTGGQHEQHQAVLDTVQDLDKEIGEVHRGVKKNGGESPPLQFH
jgi:hypothetical protein